MSKLYRIWQNTVEGYDTYDSAIVCADNEEDARGIKIGERPSESDRAECAEWAEIKHVQVEYLGEAREGLEKGKVLASFNAG